MTTRLDLIRAQLRRSSPDAAAELDALLKPRTFRRREYLVSLGDVTTHLYFLEEGTVRHYRNTPAGRMYNVWFSTEGDVITSMKSFINQAPTEEAIEALDACRVQMLSHADLHYLTARYHAAETIHRRGLEYYFITVEDRLYRMQTLSSLEKYRHLLEHYPTVIQRVPQKHIASYLGIAKETLSRLRAQISQGG